MVEPTKITCHLISRSKDGKKAEIVVLVHFANGKCKSHTHHAVWNGTAWQTTGFIGAVVESKLISGMSRAA